MDFNRTCEKNVENVVVSENTKDIIKCKAMMVDLMDKLHSVIKHIYSEEQIDIISDDFNNAMAKADDAINVIIINNIHSEAFDSDFKSI